MIVTCPVSSLPRRSSFFVFSKPIGFSRAKVPEENAITPLQHALCSLSSVSSCFLG